MTTVIINENSIGAKKMLEDLKTQQYAKVVKDKNQKYEAFRKLKRSMKEMKDGKIKPISDLFK